MIQSAGPLHRLIFPGHVRNGISLTASAADALILQVLISACHPSTTSTDA